MITAGIDVGSSSVKVVLVRDREVLGRVEEVAVGGADDVLDRLLDRALAEAGVARQTLGGVRVICSGRREPNAAPTGAAAAGSPATGGESNAAPARAAAEGSPAAGGGESNAAPARAAAGSPAAGSGRGSNAAPVPAGAASGAWSVGGSGRGESSAGGAPEGIACAARGAAWIDPGARSVIDVGAEEARAMRVDASGRVVEFGIDERCAAGAGAFLESLAPALGCALDQLGPLALASTRALAIDARCVVFAESEVVALIHGGAAPADIARAVHDAIAARVAALARRVGCRAPFLLIGGVARNVGWVDSLARALATDAIRAADQPEFCVALGAALAAAEGCAGGPARSRR
jgi:benzoyl-CoA reductase subunit D